MRSCFGPRVRSFNRRTSRKPASDVSEYPHLAAVAGLISRVASALPLPFDVYNPGDNGIFPVSSEIIYWHEPHTGMSAVHIEDVERGMGNTNIVAPNGSAQRMIGTLRITGNA